MTRRTITSLSAGLLLLASAAAAQPPAPAEKPRAPAEPSVAAPQAQSAEIAELRKLLAEQQQQIDAQRRELEALKKRLEDTQAVALKASNQLAVIEATVPTTASIEERLAQIEKATERIPDLPAEVVSAGDFPGSLHVPGTDVALKIGGQVRLTAVHTLEALGTDDRFVTSSIPVGSEQIAGEQARTNYSARPSRINLDVRSPTPVTPMRTFIEADFFGEGSTARLRHAFIQTNRFLAGQTWSTFADREAEPRGIDFEGLNAISMIRQPLLRYTLAVQEQLRLALALENPAPDLTGAEGVNLTPDFIARLRWEPKQSRFGFLATTEHVQASVLVRTLRGEPTDRPGTTLATEGFGLNVSGVLVPRWDSEDRVKFAFNTGRGIGRYITDLGTLGGQDAMFDPIDDTLRALPVTSAYVGYERLWRPKLLSAFTYGIVDVANLDIQADDSLHRTHRATVNLIWMPFPQTEFVVEFLTGSRVNKDGQRGSSSQFQLGWTFRY